MAKKNKEPKCCDCGAKPHWKRAFKKDASEDVPEFLCDKCLDIRGKGTFGGFIDFYDWIGGK